MSLEAAFYDVCSEAQEPEAAYVSLYCRDQVYGGPEEGGWWRTVITLEASEHCDTMERAKAVLQQVQKLATQATVDAKAAHGDMCRSQLESCDWDGEAAQWRYGEVDGPTEYFVTIEAVKGSLAYAAPAGYC